jgi:hypothetical protein
MNGTIQKIGEDSFYPVKNQTGSNIPKGTAVRFNGTVGSSGRLLIAKFIADGSFPSITFMGVTSEDIANGEDGKVQWFGRIRGINTNAFNEGDILYTSPTTAGGFTTVKPSSPNNVISVAAVITKSTTVGTIFVRPQIEGGASVFTELADVPNSYEDNFGKLLRVNDFEDGLQYSEFYDDGFEPIYGSFDDESNPFNNQFFINRGVFAQNYTSYQSGIGLLANGSGTINRIDDRPDGFISLYSVYESVVTDGVRSNLDNYSVGIILKLGGINVVYPFVENNVTITVVSNQLKINNLLDREINYIFSCMDINWTNY